jgi:hypothetical protein
MKRQQCRVLALAGGVMLGLGLVTAATAQEAVRMSLASAQAAEARRRAETINNYYNLKLGPTAWRLGAGLGLDYNDNVTYIQDNPLSDFIIRPQMNTSLFWPLSDRNSLNLELGAGYSAYVEHPGLSRYYITPDSELSFDLYAGDFWINLHDRVSITENTYQDPTVVGTGDYSQLQNTLGVTTTWDLNKALLRLGYDHENYSVLSGTLARPDGESEVFSASGGYAPKAGTLLGVEVGGALIQYSGANIRYTDATQWNVGGFYDGQVTEYIHFKGSGGYTVYMPKVSLTTVNEFGGFYAQFALTHRINPHVDYVLSGSRTIDTTLQGGTVDLYSLSWRANWRVIRKTSLSTSFIYYHGTQLYLFGETFDQFGPQITLGRRLTDNLVSSLGYQFYRRLSNQPGRDYSVSIVSLSLRYTF